MSVNTATIDSYTNLPPRASSKEDIFYPETDGKPMAETQLHFRTLTNLVQTLEQYFKNEEDVWTAGNLLLYYEEGNPKKCVAPDVMVCFGVKKKLLRIYQIWNEGRVPQVVFEISSTSTWKEDLSKKYALYQRLGVKEYYIFDPEYKALDESLIAYYLIDGEFIKEEIEDNKIFSPTLHLDIVDTGETLRLFDRSKNQFLMTMEEMAAKLAELEK